MRPGSIYAAFGSKEGLYKASLQCYAENSLKRLHQSLAESDSPLEGLKRFIRSVVSRRKEDAPSELCMLVKSVSELTEENAELLDESRRLLQNMEDAFEKVLIDAQQQGEIGKARSPRRLARYVQMQLIGMRAYSRAKGESQIEDLLDDAFAALQ